MVMADILIILVIAAVVGLAGWYLRRARKRGIRCVGCPGGCSCGGKCGCREHSEETSNSTNL